MTWCGIVNRCLAGVSTCVLLSGCWVGSTIKSELSAYAEPTSGELAHIRLIGSRNVKVYPNSTCASYAVPGSGYPAGPQMGGQRKRDLGMPKSPDMPKHFIEIAARANEPIVAGFSFYNPGPLGEYRSSSCYVAQSFVPEANQNYEVTARWGGTGCVLQVVQLVQDARGAVQRVTVPSAPAPGCPTRT